MWTYLLLDKTGTITLGNRQATDFVPAQGVAPQHWPMPRSWRRWPMKPRKVARIVMLAKEKVWICVKRDMHHWRDICPFTAQTRMSGVNLDGRQIRKGAADAIESYVCEQGGNFPPGASSAVERIAAKVARRWSWRKARRFRCNPIKGYCQRRHARTF